jgi:hypothetical protein
MKQVVERIKTCYDQMEESNDYIASGKWLKASEGFEKASSLIRYHRPLHHNVRYCYEMYVRKKILYYSVV